MKMNKWTTALAALGLISFTSAHAEEAKLVPVMTAVSATTISGYVDTSAQWNPGTGNLNAAPYSFSQGKQDGFNLNAVDVRISKAADETQWSAGYMVDLMFGPDASGVNGTADGFSDNIRQAYVDLHAPVCNGLSLKLGRFDNILGYEVTDSYKNPNFTRSYGYTFEPTTHTGALLSYNFSECINAQAGVTNTVTTFGINARSGGNFNPATGVYTPQSVARSESKKAFLGLITLTAPKSWGFLADDSLAFGVDTGPGALNEDRTHLYAGTTLYTPLKGLTFGVAYDAVFHQDVETTDIFGRPNDVDAGYSTAVGAYVAFKPEQSKWGAAVRAEYAKGSVLETLLLANPNSAGSASGQFHKVMAFTATVSYDLWANVLTRVEARWDHALDASNPFGGNATTATGDRANELSLIANVVYKF